MLAIEESELGTAVEVMTNSGVTRATVVERPFFDPKKSVASGERAHSPK